MRIRVEAFKALANEDQPHAFFRMIPLDSPVCAQQYRNNLVGYIESS